MEIRIRTVVKWLFALSLVVGLRASDASPRSADNADNAGALLDLTKTVQLVREQVNALIDHRQQDYNALEESLKNAMEKNTELTVLRNQVRQLRKEVNALGGGSGNEAKNERLRVKWLGSAVTELRTEIAEVLRTRNASEEIAQRSKMQSEIALLKGDVSEVGRGLRDLGGRLTKIEAALGTIRLDIFAVKERTGQLTRICADVTSQLSTVQIEMKTMKCGGDSNPSHPSPKSESNRRLLSNELSENDIGAQASEDYEYGEKRKAGESAKVARRNSPIAEKHRAARYWPSHRMEQRLSKLEHKIAIVSRKRGILEKRVVYENDSEIKSKLAELERSGSEMDKRMTKMSQDVGASIGKVDESIIRLFESVENLSEKVERNKSEEKREVAKLEVTAARKYAELSIAREELINLRRTVQALSVSASKLQEKSDAQQGSLSELKKSLENVTKLRNLEVSVERATKITEELEHVEDDYKSMVESLPGNCEDRDGLTLLGAGALATPLLVSCHKGWIVVGRRIDGMIDFDKTWREYAEGFGSPVNEFWLGNEALHRLTRDANCTSLRIDLTDIYGTRWRAEYENFNVASEDTGYRLGVSGYSGNATDALSYQNGMAFSAKDRDMDISSADCAANYRGGWWFSHCQHANLNGRYSLGLAWYRSDTNQWMAVASSVMSIQRKASCSAATDATLVKRSD